MKINLQTGIAKLLLALVLFGCQPRVWQASPTLVQTNVPVATTIAPDPQVEAMIAPYRQEFSSKMSEVLGVSQAELRKGDYQSPLGNFVTDLLLYQARKLYQQPIDVAVTNRDGLRAPLPQGQIQLEHAFEIMPFENELVVLTLDGSTMQELFDFAAATKIVNFAAASYTVRDGKATAISIGGKPFNPAQSYRVLTSDFLQKGGDNMNMFSKALKSEKVGLLLRDAIIQHIRELTAKGQSVTGQTDSRVILLP